MSSFYQYKDEVRVRGIFNSLSFEFQRELQNMIIKLQPISRFTYFCHWIINGRAFPEKLAAESNEVSSKVLSRLNAELRSATSKGWTSEIRLCDHIEERFGVSIFFCMKLPDAPEAGWVMLEQVVLKLSEKRFAIWRYADDE